MTDYPHDYAIEIVMLGDTGHRFCRTSIYQDIRAIHRIAHSLSDQVSEKVV